MSRWPRESCKFPRHLLRNRFACPWRGAGSKKYRIPRAKAGVKHLKQLKEKKNKTPNKKMGFAKLALSLPAHVESQGDAVKRFPPYCRGLSFPGADSSSFCRLPSHWGGPPSNCEINRSDFTSCMRAPSGSQAL